MSIKILATADIHIGRSPSKVPDDQARRFSCAQMWNSIVELAIQEKVDLVTLSGDVVDHDNRFFEATGPLESGFAKLAAAEIHTYAVAGNHDYDVLPRITNAVGTDYFHLLGRDGQWEQADFIRDGRPQLRIHGWSFPASHVPTSPLATLDTLAESDVPAIGMLHADLDVPGSLYAPVSRAELISRDLAVWLLGHVHRPQLIETSSGPTVIYPGSPQAMDPGETNEHGPWLIEVHGRNHVTARQILISKVQYKELSIDLTGIQTKEEFEAKMVCHTGEYLEEEVKSGSSLEFLSIRINLIGETSLYGQIDLFAEPLCEQFERTIGPITARIEKVINNTHPLIDLEELANNHDPPGILAQTLLKLSTESANHGLTALFQDAHQKQENVFRSSSYTSIHKDAAPDAEATRQRLIRQGTRLLNELLAQERAR